MNGGALELLQAMNVKPSIASPGCDDGDTRLDTLAGSECEAQRIVAAFQIDRFVRNRRFDAELLRLAERPAHERHARDTGRKAEVILDPGGRAGLSAEGAAVEREHREPSPTGQAGGDEPGR